MQPVTHNGQEYFTSQYFHAQYLANSQHGGKFKQHKNFLQALRNIEAYQLYVEQGNIVELRYSQENSLAENFSQSNSQGDSRAEKWSPLFKSIAYNPLTLMDATAQIALSHHLDDEISKQMSVAANTMVAKQASRKGIPRPTELAKLIMGDVLDAARMLGTVEHIAQQEAVKLALKETGVDYRPLLKAAPAQDAIPADQRMLEPTDLAKEFGWGENKGAAMNRALAALGWQIKKIGGGWEATPAGKTHCVENHAWTSDHGTKSGYNIKWNVEAVRQALTEAGLLGTAEMVP
jgi:hypothetical protein